MGELVFWWDKQRKLIINMAIVREKNNNIQSSNVYIYTNILCSKNSKFKISSTQEVKHSQKKHFWIFRKLIGCRQNLYTRTAPHIRYFIARGGDFYVEVRCGFGCGLTFVISREQHIRCETRDFEISFSLFVRSFVPFVCMASYTKNRTTTKKTTEIPFDSYYL